MLKIGSSKDNMTDTATAELPDDKFKCPVDVDSDNWDLTPPIDGENVPPAAHHIDAVASCLGLVAPFLPHSCCFLTLALFAIQPTTLETGRSDARMMVCTLRRQKMRSAT